MISFWTTSSPGASFCRTEAKTSSALATLNRMLGISSLHKRRAVAKICCSVMVSVLSEGAIVCRVQSSKMSALSD